MKYISVKNFSLFQHYNKKNRATPPWIKLYNRLLDADDVIYDSLSDMAKLTYIHLMLLASRHDNLIKNDLSWIRKRLNLHGIPKIKELIDAGFLIENDGELASNMLASCYQDASAGARVEERREEENREEKRRGEKKQPKSPAPDKPDATPTVPEDLFLTFPTVGTPNIWHLSESLVAEWQDAFPNLDVKAECRKAHFKLANGAVTKKTAQGMPRFFANWLTRVTDNPRGAQQKQQAVIDSPDRTDLYRKAAKGGPAFVE